MIKVIVERRIKKEEDISPLLRELRAAAIDFPGYATGETWVDTEDSSFVLTVSTWGSLQAWNKWAASDTRAKLYEKIESQLLEAPKVRTLQLRETEPAVLG